MKTGEISIIEIKAEIFQFNDIDNEKLALEMEGNSIRASYNPLHVAFEDRVILYEAGSEFEKLINKIKTIGDERDLNLIHYHLLVHEPLESTNTHHHMNYQLNTALSWVYYVSVPENAGSIVFMNDQYDMGPSCTIHPSNHMLIMFPPYVLHKVTKNMSGKRRISIAGDFAIKNKI